MSARDATDAAKGSKSKKSVDLEPEGKEQQHAAPSGGINWGVPSGVIDWGFEIVEEAAGEASTPPATEVAGGIDWGALDGFQVVEIEEALADSVLDDAAAREMLHCEILEARAFLEQRAGESEGTETGPTARSASELEALASGAARIENLLVGAAV